MATNAPFPINPALTAIALSYRNTRLIADNVLPRLPVPKTEFKYLKHTMSEGFTIPDTKVGRKSQPTQVEFTATEAADFVVDYGLEDVVPQMDIVNARQPGFNYDPLGKSVEMLTNLISLDREVRVATAVFNAANYAAANKVTLSGTSQFSDYTNSNPLAAILGYLDACVMRPNIMVMGQAVYTAIRQHPKVVGAVLGNAGTSGVVSAQAIADLLGLEAVLVGEAFLNSAKKGQATTLGRAWGKHIAFIYRDSYATTSSGTTFGFTADFQGRFATSRADEEIGLRGSTIVRVGESLKEVICANDLGYLVTNAVA